MTVQNYEPGHLSKGGGLRVGVKRTIFCTWKVDDVLCNAPRETKSPNTLYCERHSKDAMRKSSDEHNKRRLQKSRLDKCKTQSPPSPTT